MKAEKNKFSKIKMFFDLDKEIEYINQMNKKGWKLVYINAFWGKYTFVKTEPDEYITTIYAEDKENISRVTAFAAQCGYENIRCSFDSFGSTLIYLTGKKDEVSEEFVNDNDSLINHYRRITKRYRTISIIYDILLLYFLALTASYVYLINTFGLDAPLLAMLIFIIVFSVLVLSLTAKLHTIIHKNKKKIKKLKSEQTIYE